MSDAVIIGGGHNALTAAFYLARAGRKPLVLERHGEVGGGARTSELHPGFRCPSFTHEVLLHEQIVAEMDLRRHGLELLAPAVHVCAPYPDRLPIVLSNDPQKTSSSLGALHQKDAEAYPKFRDAIDAISSVISHTLTSPPPDIDAPGAGDIWNLLKTGRAFRALGRRDEFRLLRWLPMPVADLACEWFQDERLRATVAAPGISGTMLGPKSAGSALVLLMREAHRRLAGRATLCVRGGPGALTRAMARAATAAGAEIRTGVAVERILTRDDRVVGVVAGGNEIAATTVLSGVDPKTTMLDLIDAGSLSPDFELKMRNYRAAGTVAKVNLALSALPSFLGVSDASVLSGRIHIGPELDYLEKAFDHVKYGEFSSAPWLDISIPTLLDPGMAPSGAHVASIYVHYAPYALRHADWATSKESLFTTVLETIENYAPGFRSLIVAAEVMTPVDLRADLGLWGGHIFHGELALDQLYAMRPLIGFGRYDTPLRGLYLCGAGTHPGGLLSGASGRLAARRVLRTP
jgi:phytoene dehydrogenase-like protein